MTQYLYNGLPLHCKNGWVVINGTNMKLNQAAELDGFETVTPVLPPPTQPPSAEEVQAQFVANVNAEVSSRINKAASLATQLNLAAAAAGGVLTQDQMEAYLLGLNWVQEMRDTGKNLILEADSDFELDEKWPSLPDTVAALLEAF